MGEEETGSFTDVNDESVSQSSEDDEEYGQGDGQETAGDWDETDNS